MNLVALHADTGHVAIYFKDDADARQFFDRLMHPELFRLARITLATLP